MLPPAGVVIGMGYGCCRNVLTVGHALRFRLCRRMRGVSSVFWGLGRGRSIRRFVENHRYCQIT